MHTPTVRPDYQAVEQYRPRLMRQAMRLVRDQATAEDLVQECLIKAWRGLDGFMGHSALYTWLYRILLNCTYNHFNRSGREIQLTDEREEAFEMPDEATPEEHLIAKQRAQDLLEGLDGLPQSLSETLTLRHMDDLSYEEIAAALAIPVGTVRSRLSRAHRALGLK